MKNSFLIIIILLGITSSHINFLRELPEVAVTLQSVKFPTYCGDKVPSGYEFSIVLNVPKSSTIAETETTKLGLNEDGNTTAILATSCTIPATTTEGDAKDVTVSCTTKAAGTSNKNYVLTTPGADVEVVTGSLKITKWTEKTEKTAVNSDYVALDDTQTKDQSFDYKEEGTKSFKIKFANAITGKTPQAVKAGDKTISGCVIDTADATSKTYSCAITNTTVPVVDNKETSYKITITNACDEEVDTGITVKVKYGSSSSSSFINKISLIALTVFGVLLF